MSAWIRPDKREAIYIRDGWACVYCGGDEHLTLDHVTPRCRGGSNASGNLVTACRSCNSSKQGLTLSEFVDDPEAQARVRRQAKRRIAAILADLRLSRLVEARAEELIAQRIHAGHLARVGDHGTPF